MNPKYEKGIFCSQMQQIFVLKSSKFTKKPLLYPLGIYKEVFSV